MFMSISPCLLYRFETAADFRGTHRPRCFRVEMSFLRLAEVLLNEPLNLDIAANDTVVGDDTTRIDSGKRPNARPAARFAVIEISVLYDAAVFDQAIFYG
jgi:hypothetical protein